MVKLFEVQIGGFRESVDANSPHASNSHRSYLDSSRNDEKSPRRNLKTRVQFTLTNSWMARFATHMFCSTF